MNEQLDNHDAIKNIICKFKSLYKAMLKCRQNVLWKDSVAGYALINSLVNIYKLRHELIEGLYRLGNYIVFTIFEPKKRTITSTQIKDRVVQRSITDNYLKEELSRSFVAENGACLPNRGTDYMRRMLFDKMHEYYRKHGFTGGIVKGDLSSFFDSTPHKVASEATHKRVSHQWVVEKVDEVINSFVHGKDPTIGMGLGSEITQLVQLAVLDDLDHYIKEALRIKYYARYNDDFILIHYCKQHLKYCIRKIEQRINNLGLKINKKKTQLYDIKQQVRWLGFSYRLTQSGKVVVKILPEKIYREKRKLIKLKERFDNGYMSKKQVDECYQAFRSHLIGRGKNNNKSPFRLIKNNHKILIEMDKFYKSLWSEKYEVCIA